MFYEMIFSRQRFIEAGERSIELHFCMLFLSLHGFICSSYIPFNSNHILNDSINFHGRKRTTYIRSYSVFMLSHSVYLHTGVPFSMRKALAKINAIIQIEILCFRKRTLWQKRKLLSKFRILITVFTWNLSVRVRQRRNKFRQSLLYKSKSVFFYSITKHVKNSQKRQITTTI